MLLKLDDGKSLITVGTCHNAVSASCIKNHLIQRFCYWEFVSVTEISLRMKSILYQTLYYMKSIK